jgi:hypothetical protein
MPFYLDSTPVAAVGFAGKLAANIGALVGNHFWSNAYMDGNDESANPYLPTTEILERQSLHEKPDRLGLTLLCFLPGTILGLNAAVASTEGIATAIRRATIDPKGSCIFFACFSIVALGVSILYRLPRWRFLGTHRPGWLACLASGFVMVFLLFVSLKLLEMLVGPSRMPVWPIMLLLVFASSIAAVELEVLLSKRKNGKSSPLPVGSQSHDGSTDSIHF